MLRLFISSIPNLKTSISIANLRELVCPSCTPGALVSIHHVFVFIIKIGSFLERGMSYRANACFGLQILSWILSSWCRISLIFCVCKFILMVFLSMPWGNRRRDLQIPFSMENIATPKLNVTVHRRRHQAITAAYRMANRPNRLKII